MSQPEGDAAVTNVRVEDVRLIELGMAVERARSSGAGPSYQPPPVAAEDLQVKLDGVQAAIMDVRESLEQSVTPSPQLRDARIRKMASLE